LSGGHRRTKIVIASRKKPNIILSVCFCVGLWVWVCGKDLGVIVLKSLRLCVRKTINLAPLREKAPLREEDVFV
jgi:hypothetical protein